MRLKVLSLDVSLTELVSGLSEVVIGLFELLLKQRDLLGERLVGRTVSLTLFSSALGLRKLGLELLNLSFKEAILVSKGRNLLVLRSILHSQGS